MSVIFSEWCAICDISGREPRPAQPFQLRRLPTCGQCQHEYEVAGFVHVTGLGVVNGRGRHKYWIGEMLKESDLDAWGEHNGVVVFVTKHGEVWLNLMSRYLLAQKSAELAASFAKKYGCFVPLSNRGHHLVIAEGRLRDPYSNILCMHGMSVHRCRECISHLSRCSRHSG